MRVNLKAQPSCWIIDRIKAITGKKELQILDFASGSGRHSISLADPKRKITAVDNDSKKLSSYKNYQNIKTMCFDLETNEKWPFDKNYYDIVIVTNYLYRPKIKNIGNLVKENGFLFYETFATGNEKLGKPSNPDYLLKNMELIEVFKKNFNILYYFNGEQFKYKKSLIQRCAMQKKTSPSGDAFK